MKDIEAEKNRATDTYKKAEALAHEIIEMCIGKGITLKEFQMLKNVLPDARDTEIRQAKSRVGRNGLQSVSAF